MIPLALHMVNFRSVRGKQSFRFPRAPGLYLMAGANDAEPRLGANGAGKSTVWDALCWVWFGKTPRGLKAGEVCNWDAEKGTAVEFDFLLSEDDPCVWTLRRTWSPNSWTLSHVAEYVTDEETVDLVKEKDNPALSWLRLSFETFLQCVLAAQGEPMFLDLKREPQAALFSDVMGLDRWLELSARASKRASEQDRDCRALERDLAKADGELAGLGRRDLRESSEEWRRKRAGRLSALETEHGALVIKRKSLKEALERAQERETDARQGITGAQPDEELQKDLARNVSAAHSCRMTIAGQEVRLSALKDLLHGLEGEGEGPCPTCGHRMTSAHRKQEAGRVREDMRVLDGKISTGRRALRNAEERSGELDAAWTKQKDALMKARDALDAAQRESANARRALDLCDRELDAAEEAYERAGSEADPYENAIRQEREDAERLQVKVAVLRKSLNSAESRHWLYSYWVRGFKEVRLSLIAEALTELEVEVNSCVDALGLSGWELEFSVDRETKSGTVQRGFSCAVRSPRSSGAVPWEAWSGGESQRLRMAATMGLADLIRGRTSAGLRLEVWDEPTDGLSKEGVRDLLEGLAQRAKRERRQVWLIDHTIHDFGGFAGTCLVRKTAEGTHFEEGYI